MKSIRSRLEHLSFLKYSTPHRFFNILYIVEKKSIAMIDEKRNLIRGYKSESQNQFD